MMKNKNAKITISVLMTFCILMCTGCGDGNAAASSATNSAVSAASTGGTEKTEEHNKNEIRYAVENKEYGLAFPEAEYFKEELEELLYYACVSAYHKETTLFYDYLKKNGILGKEQKVILFYDEGKESYFDEADEIDRPYYDIYLWFPGIGKKQSYIRLCSYNARGACDIVDGESMDTFSKERKGWKKWGETTILLDERKAGQKVTVKQTEDFKEQIREDCQKEIKDYCGKEAEYDIYLYDFLPGDEWISGTVVNYNSNGSWPDADITIHVCYKGKKMEKYNGISWSQRSHGTMLGEVSEEDALAAIMSWRNTVAVENCFLAYRVKGDQIISLKQE